MLYVCVCVFVCVCLYGMFIYFISLCRYPSDEDNTYELLDSDYCNTKL